MKKIFTFMLFALLCSAAAAQVTTSALSGTVLDNDRRPLTGATIIATHLPSGSRYGTAADTDGHFTIQGMRSGGPYTVEISFIGFRTAEISGITLELGNTLSIREILEPDTSIEAITVTANRIFDDARTGAATNLDADAIARIPTVSRSIDDIITLSPLAHSAKTGGISFGGENNRYNSFNIDGLPSNDMYGLTSTGTNAGLTAANPIPLDALDRISIAVAPFDVRRGGFTGGSVDAVTKSGTNDFTGSAYTFYNDRNFYGTTPGRDIRHREKLSTQSTQIYGATLGGAILRDKLFFFLCGEFALESYPSTYHPGSGGAITEAEAERIAARYKSLTGYDGGGYGRRDINRTAGSLIARLDWNINDANNLSLRYNFIDGRKDEYTNTPVSFMFGGTGYTSVSRSHTIGLELNSRIGTSMHNELRAGYTTVVDGRDTDRLLPFVSIGGLGGKNATASIGTDRFAGANSLDQHTLTLTDNFSLYAGSHTLTFGTHNEFYRSHVVYVANSLGYYVYNSLEDFENDLAAQYSYNYTDTSVTGTTTWGPRFNALQLGFYAQDRWEANDSFTLTYGLRIDIPTIFDTPTVNEKFNSSTIAKTHSAVTGKVPRSQVLWSPRIGFRWHPDEAQRLVIRGGAGLFTGRVPFVWIVNNFSNTGIEQKGVVRNSTVDADGNRVTAQHFTSAPAPTDDSTINPSVQVLDSRFRYPQLFRADLAAEYTFSNGWHVAIEGLYGKTVNNVTFKNLSLTEDGRFYPAEGNTPSAAHYAVHPDYSSVYYTTNTSLGYSCSLTASVERSFPFGLEVGAYYTLAHARSLNDATSSAQATNWTRTYAVDADAPRLSRSAFDAPHTLTARISYSKRYGRIFGTTAAIVYRLTSGQPYSLCYADTGVDINGDGTFGNTLLYIPTTDDLRQMNIAPEDAAHWEEFIVADGYMRTHRGRFTERNAFSTPIEHRLDLHLAQDFYFGSRTSRKVQVTLDVVNLGNMICRDWGAVWSVSGSRLTPVKVSKEGDGYRYAFTGAEWTKEDILSRWHMQLGIRVVF